MSQEQGAPIWYELMTADPDAAADFYGALLGWTVAAAPGPDTGYRLFQHAGTAIGGLMARPEGAAMPPSWRLYLSVTEADAVIGRIAAEGGQVLFPATDIAGVGRFALLRDPQGAAFSVMQPAYEGRSESFHPTAAGHARWNELAVPDPAAALDFYGRHFGWQRKGAMPMGEMGEYQFLAHHDQVIGAVMPLPPGRPPGFLTYFGVPGIDTAAAAVRDGGGTVLFGPNVIPGGEFVLIALDPQGAAFGLVGPRQA
ncbi:VOC family protein [Roseomonas sp. OT10]|uniref:VOC family protein n=1 Tax=Roseomonas cutis TaxID=2897332 RepID=UPI001E2C4B26|nr:VOC family protein [Roseomonas sp. OT10]UFN48354.1 VOC family protein [Roseomonas sp. OT10]